MAHLGKNAVIVLALLAAGFLTAYLRFHPYLHGAGGLTDGERIYAGRGDEAIRHAVWLPPEPLDGEVNSRANETRPALSPDGRWLVFSVGEVGLGADLWIAELVAGEPTEPRPLDELNSLADDAAPCFGPDALWFASNRGGGEGGLDLYRAEWRDGSFGPAANLGSELNGAADDTDPAPAPDGSRVLFASNRSSWLRSDFDLYVAEPGGGVGGTDWDTWALDELNGRADEREPSLAADGRTLVFASDRRGGEGDFDLYRSIRDPQGWTDVEPLRGVNTAGAERAPWIDADGFTLWLAAGESGTALDLMRARSRELYHVPGRPVGWIELLLIAALLLLALVAFLAKRWEGLELLYKCFLFSVLVHLLLAWFFRDLFPAGSALEPPGSETLFRVRLADPPSALDDELRERAGELSEIAPERPAAAPERAPVGLDLTALEDAPRELELEAGELPLDTPERSAARPEPATAPELAAAELRDHETPAEPLNGRPRELEHAPQSFAAQREASRPERGGTVVAAASDAEPLRDSVDPGRAPIVPPARAPSADSRADALERAAAADVELRQPAELLDLARADVAHPGLDLGAPAPAPARERTRADAPRRSSPGGALRSSAAPPAPRAAQFEVAAAPQGAPLTASAAPPVRSEPRPLELALQDREDPREAERAEPDGDANGDLLASLAPAAVERRRRADERGPARREVEALRQPQSAPALPRSAPLEALARTEDRPPLPEPKRWNHTPYQSRSDSAKRFALDLHGGSEETERAVAAGLAYLARIQRRDGSWGDARDHDDKYGDVRVGKTGLCLLAFLGAGHVPDGDGAYAGVAQDAIEFLLESQDRGSGHFGDCSAYGHGIATYALAECYAMTSDPNLRLPLRRAIRHVLANQIVTRDQRYGGWSYYYRSDRTFDAWPRVSVSAWQVMALESARLGGLEVPDEAFADARRFLLGSWDERRGWFRYSHDPERLGSGYPTLPASTPAGLFCLSLLGEDVAATPWREARRFVLARAPEVYRRPQDDDFVFRARGNLYFWYYGTLAMFRVGGDGWNAWNERMKATLLPAQEGDGSWEPISIYARYAGDDARDRSYTTAMCVLTLEIYYRYFTPLLEVR